MERTDEGQLISRAMGGDGDAFTELVRRYRDMVYGYCYHRTGSFEDARDLAQETFVRAYTRLGQLNDASKLAAWLRQIATNICNRWHGRRRELAVEEMPECAPAREDPRAELVRHALSGLPEKERLAVVLHYVNGYSYSEIAGFLDVTSNAVRGRLHRGREMLKAEVLKMTRESFESNKLDEQFVIETVKAAIDAAADAYNMLQDKELSRRKTDEAAALVDPVAQDGITNPVVFANALVSLGVRECVLGEWDRAHGHWDRARLLFEQAGDRNGVEELRAMTAYERLSAGDFAAAHELYSQVAAYCIQRGVETSDASGYSYLAAARALESMGLNTEKSRIAAFHAYGFWFERKDGKFLVPGGAGLGFIDGSYPRRVGGPPPYAHTLLPLILIRDEPEVGDTLRFVDNDDRAEESVLETLSDTVTTPAGTFENCARTSNRIFASDAWEGEPVAYRKLWIARGVGVVKITYQTAGEQEDTSELTSYHIESPTDDYIPLAIGNWWKWRWVEGEVDHGFRTEMYDEIAAQEGDTCFALRYTFAVKKEV